MKSTDNDACLQCHYQQSYVTFVGTLLLELFVGNLCRERGWLSGENTRPLRFSSLHKNQHFQIPIRPVKQWREESLCGFHWNSHYVLIIIDYLLIPGLYVIFTSLAYIISNNKLQTNGHHKIKEREFSIYQEIPEILVGL